MALWKGLVFAVSLFLTCFFGTLVLLLPFIPLGLKWPVFGRRIMDAFLWLWFVLAVAVYEWFMGVKIVIHGRPAPPSHSVLILCNHRTRLDWLFLMSYQLRCGSLMRYKISLKAPLKSLPGPGWAMQCAGFLFLQRVWKQDEGWISRSLKYFMKVGSHPQFLLFPEGTDYGTSGLEKSHTFASTNGLPMYHNVLHPRTTGFIHFVNTMKENEILDSVLDVTVAYPKNIVHGEAELTKGIAPQEVHFYAQNHLVSDLPQSADKLEAWCRHVWAEKEATLTRFYKDKTFVVNGKEPDLCGQNEQWVQQVLWAVMGFWFVFMAAVFYALLVFPLFKWYCLFSALTFFFITVHYGGVDALLYATSD